MLFACCCFYLFQLIPCLFFFFFFFFNDTATTEIYTLSLHDALPIFHHQRRREGHGSGALHGAWVGRPAWRHHCGGERGRSGEHLHDLFATGHTGVQRRDGLSPPPDTFRSVSTEAQRKSEVWPSLLGRSRARTRRPDPQ